MFNLDDLEQAFAQARNCATIIGLLAQGDTAPRADLYVFLADELDARFEQIQVEIENANARSATLEPPPMPPKTAEEIAFSAELTAGLSEAADRRRQRNLDRAIVLARQAAEGTGPLVNHFAELGRRFGGEGDK